MSTSFSTTKSPAESELNSAIHKEFRFAHEGHQPHASLDPTRASTGVIWCTERANEAGFSDEPKLWANLGSSLLHLRKRLSNLLNKGQGAPEVDDEIEGCFERPRHLDISVNSREYGPTAGIRPLRAAVANLYNEHHRQGKESKYTWENVCIVPGGRAGLIRIAAVLGNAYLGFFVPDYTAYSEMLSLFKSVAFDQRMVFEVSLTSSRNFAAVPIPLTRKDNYKIHPGKVADEIARGTSIILTSNPRNPTGHVLDNPELAEMQDICRDRATLIMDEVCLSA